ncbi:Ran-binding protein 1 [Intoshia linei]|uniref:Ran-binding protein 1 n=1 Tax=Intoshia linei TaxID=1819745 RepID=A0A177BCQ8_9BILA|nr:Ran-binding protein 1 [Intoshia linei]
MSDKSKFDDIFNRSKLRSDVKDVKSDFIGVVNSTPTNNNSNLLNELKNINKNICILSESILPMANSIKSMSEDNRNLTSSLRTMLELNSIHQSRSDLMLNQLMLKLDGFQMSLDRTKGSFLHSSQQSMYNNMYRNQHVMYSQPSNPNFYCERNIDQAVVPTEKVPEPTAKIAQPILPRYLDKEIEVKNNVADTTKSFTNLNIKTKSLTMYQEELVLIINKVTKNNEKVSFLGYISQDKFSIENLQNINIGCIAMLSDKDDITCTRIVLCHSEKDQNLIIFDVDTQDFIDDSGAKNNLIIKKQFMQCKDPKIFKFRFIRSNDVIDFSKIYKSVQKEIQIRVMNAKEFEKEESASSEEEASDNENVNPAFETFITLSDKLSTPKIIEKELEQVKTPEKPKENLFTSKSTFAPSKLFESIGDKNKNIFAAMSKNTKEEPKEKTESNLIFGKNENKPAFNIFNTTGSPSSGNLFTEIASNSAQKKNSFFDFNKDKKDQGFNQKGFPVLNKSENKPFAFSNFNSSLNTSDGQYECTADFKPVVSLDNVEMQSGEEAEVVFWESRSKCYRLTDNTWIERGTGTIKILHHTPTNTYRVILRRDTSEKICVNFKITHDINPTPNADSVKSICLYVNNFVDEGESLVTKHEQIALRFKYDTICNEFVEKLKHIKSIIGNSKAQEKSIDLNEKIMFKIPEMQKFENYTCAVVSFDKSINSVVLKTDSECINLLVMKYTEVEIKHEPCKYKNKTSA